MIGIKCHVDLQAMTIDSDYSYVHHYTIDGILSRWLYCEFVRSIFSPRIFLLIYDPSLYLLCVVSVKIVITKEVDNGRKHMHRSYFLSS